MDELIYWIWLANACAPGSKNTAKLFASYSSPRDIYALDEADLTSLVGSRSSDYATLTDKSLDRAREIFEFCTRRGVGILTYADENYPKLLREISNPPVLLYYRGTLPRFNDGFFASVVGTRRLTDYGRRNAFYIGRDLARAGAVVVSGMAMGIDGVAQAGALSVGGVAVAVIGTGIDVCYPKEHLTLAREIVKSGCVLTEFAPGTKVRKENFPIRNRIISGISAATVVIEGGYRSGSLITARSAVEQGRVLYALPGNVDERSSIAGNQLIKNGARLITAADDIIADFSSEYRMLNPFKLAEPIDTEIMSTLSRYSVSATAPSDKIFLSRRAKAEGNRVKEREQTKSPSETPEATKLPDGIPEAAIALYKRIPESDECSVESLVSPDADLRVVMRLLLKLEMARLVDMLPGERVKRSFRS